MTVVSDLKKTIAQAQSLLGQYMTFGESTDDPAVKTMFQQFAEEMEGQIDALNMRVTFLENNNILNKEEAEKQKTVTKK